MLIPASVSEEQRQLLTRWTDFLKAAVPVIESTHNDAAQRYAMFVDRLTGDHVAEWAAQHELVQAFVAQNRAAIVENNPAKLPRDTRDAWFPAPPGAEIAINVATVLFSCQDTLYANGMWGLVRNLVSPDLPATPLCGAPQQPSGAPPPMDFLMQLVNSVQQITDQVNEPIPDGTELSSNVVCERVMRCLQSQQMAGFVSTVMQQTMSNVQQQGGAEPTIQSIMSSIFGGMATPQR